MLNAIIMHGKPSKAEYYDPKYPCPSNNHWLPWLQKELVIRGIAAATPEVPLAFEPRYDRWCAEAERYVIGVDTALIGHSCGGGFWLRYLSEHPKLTVGKVVLVAPSLGVGWGGSQRDFFDFELDPSLINRTKGVTVLVSDDDKPSIHESVQTIVQSLKGAKKQEFSGYRHFTFSTMKTAEFPELIEAVMA